MSPTLSVTLTWVSRLVRVLLAGAFLLAAVLKLRDPAAFAVTIRGFGLLPGELVPAASIVLPVLEIAAALGLLLDRPWGRHLYGLLLLLFLAVLSYGLWLGLDVDCGCYGPGDPEAEAFSGLRAALWRDLGLAAGLASLYWQSRRRKPAPAPHPNLSQTQGV